MTFATEIATQFDFYELGRSAVFLQDPVWELPSQTLRRGGSTEQSDRFCQC